MRRNSSCPEDVERLNRGAWTAQEDKSLTSYIMVHGEGKWSHVPFRAGNYTIIFHFLPPLNLFAVAL